MEIKIQKVDNGYLLTTSSDFPDNPTYMSVYEEKNVDMFHDLETLRELTYDMWHLLGYTGSKHDKQRLFCEIKDQDG